MHPQIDRLMKFVDDAIAAKQVEQLTQDQRDAAWTQGYLAALRTVKRELTGPPPALDLEHILKPRRHRR